MGNRSPSQLSDSDLLAATAAAAHRERHTTVELLVLLAEVDKRRLYLSLGSASLFTYCTQALHLSESSAYSRITAARLSRRFPIVLGMLASGEISLTTITLLGSHLTDDNCNPLLEAARHKSRRQVELIVAAIDPQPVVASLVRRVAGTVQRESTAPTRPETPVPPPATASDTATSSPVPAAGPRSVVAPLAPERYLLRVTLSREGYDLLTRASQLLRRAVPNGDPAAIVERAMALLVERLEKDKVAGTEGRHGARRSTRANSRHVPAAVKRTVWTRDAGRCAFVGTLGRCTETAFLEFHHVVPFADRGRTVAENIQLRCRAHNLFEADCWEGRAEASGETRARGVHV